MAATKTAPKEDGQKSVEHLQSAMDELTKARARASEDIRAAIDSAIERTRGAMKGAGEDAHEQISDWQRSLERATEELRRELGVVAVRAQRSPEGLKAMSSEIRKRKTELTA